MIQVPLLEEQETLGPSQFEFYYDRIQLVLCSQTRYDAMWALLNDLSADDFALLAIFRDLDKLRKLTDDQQQKLELVIPE